MGQFDNFKSVAMLFTGAFLVSFGVIAFLNIEIQSRSTYGVKIRNENLFEVLGRKINEFITTIRERNSHRRSVLYHLFAPENATRTPLRKLQHFTGDPDRVDSMAEQYFNRTHRHLRHVKKIKRLTELLLREKNNSLSREITFDLEKEFKSNGNGFIAVFNNIINNRTSMSFANNSIHKEISEEDLKVHQHCYTTNDVLEIIAITCLVNFIFWFMIIFFVNIFTKNQQMWRFDRLVLRYFLKFEFGNPRNWVLRTDSPPGFKGNVNTLFPELEMRTSHKMENHSFESLTSIGSGSECELNRSHSQKERDFQKLSHQNFLGDYVNSSTAETEGDNSENEPQEHFSCGFLQSKVTTNGLKEKLNAERWIHQRFIHLSNIFFDTVSLDNLKPVKKKNLVSRNKNNKIVNSLSMEDLIF